MSNDPKYRLSIYISRFSYCFENIYIPKIEVSKFLIVSILWKDIIDIFVLNIKVFKPQFYSFLNKFDTIYTKTLILEQNFSKYFQQYRYFYQKDIFDIAIF